jgi:hypothetical protein
VATSTHAVSRPGRSGWCTRLLVVVGGVTFAACTPQEIRACNAAATRAPADHLRVCAQLFKAEPCRRFVLDLDGGLPAPTAHVAACRADYCGRAPRPLRACAGEVGTPASGYDVEVEFYAALFEVDYGRSAQLAELAWKGAASRVFDELKAEEDRRETARAASAVLAVDLRVDGDAVALACTTPVGGPTLTLAPDALDAARCLAFIQASLDGGAPPPDAVVRVTAAKNVKFRSVRCVMDALVEAGFADQNILFGTMAK